MNDGTCLSVHNIIGLKIAISDAFDLESVFYVNKLRSLIYGNNLDPREMLMNPGVSLKSACQ